MLTIKQLIKLSAVIDKMQLKVSNPKAPAEEVGADLLMQAVGKLRVAEREIYEFVAAVNGVTSEEAQNVDIMEFVKEFLSESDLKQLTPFFTHAVK